MAPGRRKSKIKFTMGYLEMDIMSAVWKHGEVTVRTVFEELYPTKKLAYTTVMTVMKRLVHKGMLSVDKAETPFTYEAVMESGELATKVVDEVINRLLGGASAPLVLHYLQNKKLSPKDEKVARTLLVGSKGAKG